MSEWKPGTVLGDGSGRTVYAIEVTANSLAAAETKQAWEEGSSVIEPDGNGWHASHFDNLHPLVVIDPESTQHLDRLRYLLIYSGWVPQRDADALDDILREFGGHAPSKPDEPTDTFARVRDTEGRVWCRMPEGGWKCDNGYFMAHYELLEGVVEVLT